MPTDYEMTYLQTNVVRLRAAIEGQGPLVILVHGWPGWIPIVPSELPGFDKLSVRQLTSFDGSLCRGDGQHSCLAARDWSGDCRLPIDELPSLNLR